MRALLPLSLVALTLAGCLNIPGIEEGGPCNSRGVCGQGLLCAASRCVKERGRGSWVELPAPPASLAALWGSSAQAVYAVGDGAFQLEGGRWQALAGVPTATYRAVWGRAAEQVWIGGDDVLLAKSPAGWQQQALRQRDGTAITQFSVLALAGGSSHEYALVSTGGRVLALTNSGVDWRTLLWSSGGGGPALPPAPSLVASDAELLVGGAAELVFCDQTTALGVPSWQSTTWRVMFAKSGQSIPPLRSLSGAIRAWVGAGGATIARYDGDSLVVRGEDRLVDAGRDATAVFVSSPERAFVVGRGIRLRAPDPVSAVVASPIEACDTEGCTLERVPVGREASALRAVWADDLGGAIAVGDGIALRRTLP